MANVKVAINGFGRIGRLAFRQMFGAKGYDVVAINDLTNPRMLAHLLKYDSAQGRYALADKVTATDNSIIVDGKEIKIYAEKNAADLPWGEIGVDVVLECTGFYCSKAKSQAHIDAGAKKVVISAPAGNDLPTIVYSVNEKTLTAADTIISAASCTTNCLAPMANTLNKFAKIKKGYMTTIHAYTGDQMTLDGPHRKDDLRRARAAAVNIVPNSTGAAKAIGLVIPELNGVLDGCAQRVPVPTGSLTQLTAIVDGEGFGKEIYGNTLAATLAGVRDDEKVKAVVLRVNSPGGSALASDVIWREMELLKAEKPVVVSMGSYAASGGYYISCPADVIVADKLTLTGSIGVFGMYLNTIDAFKNKLGITFDAVKSNTSAGMGASIPARKKIR